MHQAQYPAFMEGVKHWDVLLQENNQHQGSKSNSVLRQSVDHLVVDHSPTTARPEVFYTLSD